MEDSELEKYKDIIKEISDLKLEIEKYLYGGSETVAGMSYGDAVKKLSYLKNRLRNFSKEVKKRYNDSKDV